MSELNTGQLGAKRQSYHGDSPRAILLDVVKRNPRASDDRLFDIFFDRAAADADALRAIAKYWFANEFRRLTSPQPRRREVSEAQAAAARERVAQLKTALKTHIDQQVSIILSEILMPNGAKLRDCTKRDCAKAGGWLSKVGARLKSGQRVGEVFSEDQLRKLYSEK